MNHVKYLPQQRTGSETHVIPQTFFTFDLVLGLECLILRWPLVRYFRKQHFREERVDMDFTQRKVSERNNILILENVN